MKSFVLLLALFGSNALAQHPAALERFAGSRANYESLQRGLRGGTEIRLVSLTPDGMREIVTFTAAEALPSAEAARVLENARYHLLERGIPQPSGWDIALVLVGRLDIAPAGPVWQPGLLRPANPDRPLVVALRPFAGSASNYRSLLRGLARGTPVILRDPVDGRSRITFAPACTLGTDDAREALLAVAERLSARGINDPLMGELRAAVLEELEARCA